MIDQTFDHIADMAPSADALADQFGVERQEGAAACRISPGEGLAPLAPCIINPVGRREGLGNKNVLAPHDHQHEAGAETWAGAKISP